MTILRTCLLLLIHFLVGQVALGQQETSKPQSTDEVVRINAELVQTGVAVFDKQGQFVDGLKKENFELHVDGRLVPISFFENIVAGTQRERSARARVINESPLVTHSFRRRTIIFFLDDRHLALDSLGRTRKTLFDFINKEMGRTTWLPSLPRAAK
jgi:hypothetical protein